MGHFYSKNFAETAIRLFEANTLVTMRDVVDDLKANGEVLHAADGLHDEDNMMLMGTEQLFFGWKQYYGCIKPHIKTERQREVLAQFEDDGADLEIEDYDILDSIQWKTTGERMPVIDYIPS